MFKMLLASTALTALVTTSAFAQSDTAPAAPAATAETTTTAPMTSDQNVAMDARSSLASDLIGAAVYDSASEDASIIGDINDIVITPEGDVASVIVGVGGFLGIGEKDVAVEYSTIEWADRDGERWIVANMSREQLEAAPAFDRTAIYTEARSENENMTADTTQPAVVPQTADGTQATAPATTTEKVENGDVAVERAQQETTPVDRSKMTAVNATELSADDLIGRTVYGANDENIGEVGDVLLTADNRVEGFVLDVGGFLGMGEKEIAVSPENLNIMADANGDLTIFTPFSEEQLKQQTEYSEENWKSNRDGVILIAPAG
ncbi:MAG: PRC-barrel domain-containing protein [Hoeflea sp.]|mgnify:CR=1 FL=1|uniref:PRC-barrel domain-containing protein n=1 Tax=Hoeflea sp. TaxID=1940281 RepID=UPI00329987DF|tara:strand:+ start:23179 stop:24138 length:960 start_codon:yes stop_codon:yes gene_type:complete